MLKAVSSVASWAVGFLLVSPALIAEADAAEIRVLSAAVMKPVLTEIADSFEQTTGHKLAISYVPAGEARRRVETGATFDVAILQRPAAEDLVQLGKIDRASMKTVARSGLAVAVRRGTPKPDVSTVDAFRRALLAAKSVSYPDPAQGHAAGA